MEQTKSSSWYGCLCIIQIYYHYKIMHNGTYNNLVLQYAMKIHDTLISWCTYSLADYRS